ncbi:MAG TPA: RpiB/LacA/LacB family sugar-phosphate isomerase [Candidatus Paceibacterota bacterium]|jgi:ribose 5-phosphate isomerase B|nr:RpiB/LacA/LacB family sugar-phosphate isomerase [Candidatus Paceibacterota bacterium]
MKIYIGADHSGYELKEKLKIYLIDLGLGYQIIDKGAFEYNPEDDYPDFITQVAQSVANDHGTFGIIIGGSGQGEAMCANRVHGARAALFYGEVLPTAPIDINGEQSADPFEIVKLARLHNDANILSIGVRFTTEDSAKFAIELFLKTEFQHQERHMRRLAKFLP